MVTVSESRRRWKCGNGKEGEWVCEGELKLDARNGYPAVGETCLHVTAGVYGSTRQSAFFGMKLGGTAEVDDTPVL